MSYRTDKQTISASFIEKTISTFEATGEGLFQDYRVPFSERRVLLMTVDGLLVLLATWCAFLFWGQTDNGVFELVNSRMVDGWYWYPILLTGWWILAWLNDLYDIPSSYDTALSSLRVSLVAGIGLCIYLFIYFVVPADFLPRIFFLNFLFVSTVAVAGWRYGYVRLSETLPFRHRVLIIGTGARSHIIADALKEAPGLKYEVVGYAEETDVDYSSHENSDIVGSVADLATLTEQYHVHEVIVAMENSLDQSVFSLLVDCQANGVRVSWMPDLYEQICRKIPIRYIDPAWALQGMQGQPVFSRLQLSIKRLLDIILVLSVTPTIMLIVPLVALAIRLDSKGSIFYKQTRCGRAGKPFSIYKFRTMTTDAEKDGKARWATANDQRITKVGRILRKTRLDELPQIFNILRGEMSLVGPRPERPEFVEQLQEEIPYYRTRLMVKPGLTGWAQVHYDYGNTVEDALIKLQYDFYYVRYWSVWLDIYTMFQTFAVVFKLKGT